MNAALTAKQKETALGSRVKWIWKEAKKIPSQKKLGIMYLELEQQIRSEKHHLTPLGQEEVYDNQLTLEKFLKGKQPHSSLITILLKSNKRQCKPG
jgi:hypothetical protein